ncbi:hypothetical protein WJX72_008704 [[Myrmecia] bisecta]|uniref:Inward rectifier potassium channel n=1 Tax=[Myrmecia] bisecta TaxID=41462 RepID=A0AAW1PKU2_9CHLO
MMRFETVERKGLGLSSLYTADLFHTLLNIPKLRFCVLFFAAYLLQYTAFASLYFWQSEHCIEGIHNFLHALWFSVQTSATIGYGGADLTPNPDCPLTNIIVTLQVVVSALLDYSMLGLVYARFANPAGRAQTIRFSRSMAMYRKAGLYHLTFRVANVRKHQVLQPEVRMLLLSFDVDHPDADAAGYLYQDLPVQCMGRPSGQLLWLGLPTSVTHVVDKFSPLAGMSPDQMQERGLEIVVLLDGVDATTSARMQARYSYQPTDIRINEQFDQVVQRNASNGMLNVNFAAFDATSSSGASFALT